jgi:hypothetical protein
MPSLAHVCIGSLAATLYWTLVGLPFARQLLPPRIAWAIAPAMGWAMQSAAALPIFLLIGFSFRSAFFVCALMLAGSLLLALMPAPKNVPTRFPLWAFAAAGVIALAPAAVVLPKTAPDGIALAIPIFDHAKVAIIDQIAREGLPVQNPFFGPPGEPLPLAYYYLWHFSAAELALLTGITGWEADAAVSWFTAFSGLMLMAGLAVWLSNRMWSAAWALLFALSGSIRPWVLLLFSGEGFGRVILPNWGFAGWFYQLSWAPQHVAAASSAVLGILVIARAAHLRGVLQLAMLALLAAAACESSVWIGGIVFPAAAAAAGATVLLGLSARERISFLLWAGTAALAALAIAAPFLREQLSAFAMREGGTPIALDPYGILGIAFPESLRRILDLPAYWLVLLVLETPAVYIAGCLGLWWYLRTGEREPDRKSAVATFAGLAAAGLLVSWLFASTITDNNDLGWRGALPALVVLIVFAAAAVPEWLARRRHALAGLAIALLLVGLPATARNIRDELRPRPTASAHAFAETPAMWEAVRRHTSANERIVNNPLLMADMTAWPVNISWALLANRASCFAGRELALAFVPIPRARRSELDQRFDRVFAGHPEANDLGDLATRYGCKFVVLTAQDGAWTADPFAKSELFQLVLSNEKWRLYRRTDRN